MPLVGTFYGHCARVRWQLYWCLWCGCRVRCWWESVLTVEVFTRPDPAPDWGHCHRCTSRGHGVRGRDIVQMGSHTFTTYLHLTLTRRYSSQVPASEPSIAQSNQWQVLASVRLSTCSSCYHKCYWDLDFHHALISFYPPCYGSKCALNILFWWCSRYIFL